jgi:Bacterial Ig-like domain
VRATAGEGTPTRVVVAVATAGGPSVTVDQPGADGWFAFELPVAALADGTFNVHARLYDGEELIAVAPYRPIMVDSTPPGLAFNPMRTHWRPGDAPITVSWEVEWGARTTCSFGLAKPVPASIPPAPCSDRFKVPAYSDGAYEVTVVATDDAGNIGTYRQPLTFDNAFPLVTLTDGPAEGELRGRRAEGFAIAVADRNPGTTACTFDGEPIACGERLEITGLTDGGHAVEIAATDLAGNTMTVRRAWTVDATAPALTLDGPADGARVRAGAVAYAAAAVDASPLTLACRWDDAPPAPCGERFERTLTAGTHRFEATATDAAGNVSTLVRTVVTEPPPEPGPQEPPGQQPPPDQQPPTPGERPSTPRDPGGTPEPPQVEPLSTALAGPRATTVAALRHGVRLTVGCSRRCRSTLRLRSGGRTLASVPVSVGRGRARVTVRLPRGRALPRRARVTFALAVETPDGSRDTARLTRTLGGG